MKHTTSEALDEVLARRDRIRRKRERRRTAWYGVSVCVILVVLTMTVTSLPASTQTTPAAEHMGSFLLEAKTGGILAALILAFVLGVLAALLLIRYRRSKKPKDRAKPYEQQEKGGSLK